MRPRKGTKTLLPFSNVPIIIIYKDETPEGDENPFSVCIVSWVIRIYKDETPEGDENQPVITGIR